MTIDIDSIYDTIQADQIENGDQVIIDGDALENVTALPDLNDRDGVIVTGWSVESGDQVSYTLPYDYSVSLWAI